LVYAVGREPDRLDPTRSALAPSQMVYFQMYDCLVARAPDNQYHPWLASTWEISPDGLAYTFNLQSGVTFHDKTPFNAQAVKFNLDRVHDPDSPTKIAPAAYGYYVQTDTPSDSMAVIRLSKPWPPLLDALSYSYRFVSPAAVQKSGDSFAQNPVGTGPFIFKEWVPNDHITMVKNPDYNWASPMFAHKGAPYLDEVTFKQIPEANTRVAALESNQVQVMEVLPSQEVTRIKADSNYEVLVGVVPGRPYGYTINMRKPPTDELEVRQAMQYAIDQEAVTRVIFGPMQPLGAFLPTHGVLVPITWSYDKSTDIYNHDPEKAKQLLETAGWKVGANGIRQKNGQPLQILVGTWESQGVEEVIQQQFRDVGIDWKIQVANGLATNEAARREEIHMSPLPAGRSDPDILSLNHSRNRPNGFDFTYHNDHELDDLFDAGASATNDDERLKIYSQIQLRMMQDAMFLSVYQYDNVSARRSAAAGKILFDRGLFPYVYDVYIAKK
jgi:peptide/nickel transport system substrate-binding protein